MAEEFRRPRPLVLIVIDGYGISPLPEGNAVMKAKQPNLTRYYREYPCAAIRAAGIEAGLPWGEMGNSETGHQNIGSGRVMYQPLPQVDLAIEDKSFFNNSVLLAATERARKNKGASFHIMGVLSDGGVHGHINHIIELVRLAQEQGLGDRTFVHAFLDGRDSPPDSAGNYVNQLQKAMKKIGGGKLATLVGRYFAMDRNQNWDRTKIAYDLLARGEGKRFEDWQEAIRSVYDENDFKSFEVAPAIVMVEKGKPVGLIKEGDAVVFSNYRSDRAMQLTAALVEPEFKEFATEKFKDLFFVTMTQYADHFTNPVAFPKQIVDYPLGRVLSEAGLTQLRVAESEKFAHVTYFFDGGREQSYEGEDREMVPSLNIQDYAKKPEMSAEKITNVVVGDIEAGKHDVIVVNYANPDMVGHTGNFEATVKALEFLDGQIGRVVEAALGKGGAVLITADHGNAEMVVNPLTHKRTTDHTNNPVPLIYINDKYKLDPPKDEAAVATILEMPVGLMADVAPTVLEILGVGQPVSMTAQSLLSSLV